MPDGSFDLMSRSDDLLDDEEIETACEKLYDSIAKGWDDQRERTDKLMDIWELYNCELGRFQNYSGMSKIFVPIVRNAINSLVVRYINQSFPNSGRHVECVTGESDQPYALLSLLEHYISESKLRTQAATELLTNGQIEGQYNAYFHWSTRSRVVVSREEKPIKVGGVDTPEAGTLSVTTEEEIEDSCPMIEVLHDSDVLVLPATSSSVEEALELGGCAVVLRRWTKAQIEKMIDDGEIDEDVGDELIDQLGMAANEKVRDTEKKLAASAGIQVGRGKFFAVVWEAWAKLDVNGKKRLCRIFFTGGENKTAGVRLNPFWNDRCPIRSAPVKKLPGVFKGESPVASSQDMQILANDMANEGADMMYYTLAPIVAVNPQLVSKWKELVADIAAVWPVEPDGVKMFEWPNKVREAFEVVQICKTAIFEALQVNPAMVPQQTGKPGAKRNQAEIALEQQVDILQTSDAVTNFEQEILTPFVQWSAELDHQFRDKDILVREFGELGLKAAMDEIPPIQWGKRWEVKWIGVEAQRNAMQIQQMISFANVVKEVPPELYQGYKLNMAPMLEYMAGVSCGPRLGRLTFSNMRDENSTDPQLENDLLSQSFEVLTHASDDDQKHLQVHSQLPPGPERDAHMRMHQTALQLKAKAQMMQQLQAQGINPQQQGKPPQKRRTGQGTRSGAMPGKTRQNFAAPGGIRPDQMAKAGTALVSQR